MRVRHPDSSSSCQFSRTNIAASSLCAQKARWPSFLLLLLQVGRGHTATTRRLEHLKKNHRLTALVRFALKMPPCRPGGMLHNLVAAPVRLKHRRRKYVEEKHWYWAIANSRRSLMHDRAPTASVNVR